jgi:predicted dehydrogenase
MRNKKFRVGLVGCGLIGNHRSNSLGRWGTLIAVTDKNTERAKKISIQKNAKLFNSWREMIKLKEIDILIIATTHNSLSEIAIAAIKENKHLLIEKPAGRNSNEIKRIISANKTKNLKIRVGFNHRHHRSFRKAKSLVESGKIGELMFLRARYGHGARIGYDREWRADPKISGGGELLDQGSHLIDLSRWFLGNFVDIKGAMNTYYWDMDVDDNAFMILKNKSKQVAFLHVSCTEWKNTFSMEIYGKKGKLEVSGLGGSYGTEKLTYYKMHRKMGPPETFSWEYPMKDNSWAVEIEELYKDIIENRTPAAGLNDALESIKIVESLSRKSGYDHSKKSS